MYYNVKMQACSIICTLYISLHYVCNAAQVHAVTCCFNFVCVAQSAKFILHLLQHCFCFVVVNNVHYTTPFCVALACFFCVSAMHSVPAPCACIVRSYCVVHYFAHLYCSCLHVCNSVCALHYCSACMYCNVYLHCCVTYLQIYFEMCGARTCHALLECTQSALLRFTVMLCNMQYNCVLSLHNCCIKLCCNNLQAVAHRCVANFNCNKVSA